MQTIYLDISNKGVLPIIYAKQGDVGRKFLAVITDAGIPFNPLENAFISVFYQGKSGSGNYSSIGEKSAFTVTENKVVVELIAQMVLNPGDGVCSLVLNYADGMQIATWNIRYCVEGVPGIDSEEAEIHYTALSEVATNAKIEADRAELAAERAVNATEYKQNKLTWLTDADLDAMWDGTYEGVEDEDNNGFVKNKVFVDSATGDLYQLFVQNGELKMKEAE